MKFFHAHLAGLACVANVAMAGWTTHSFIFEGRDNENNTRKVELGPGDCADGRNGISEYFSVVADCDWDDVCSMGSNQFCVVGYDEPHCQGAPSEVVGYDADVLDKPIINLEHPDHTFKVTKGSCGDIVP